MFFRTSKFLLFLLIAATTANPFSNETVESTTTAPLNDDETLHIATNLLFRISFLVEGAWSHEFNDPKSYKFRQLRDNLDDELRAIVLDDSHVKLITGTFRLLRVFPAQENDFLYVVLSTEAEKEEIATEWIDAIESQILINDKLKLSQTRAKLMNSSLHMTEMNDSEIFNIESGNYECDKEFCRPIFDSSVDSQGTINSPLLEQCRPRETINRGKTSIFIFDSQNCVDQVQDELKSSGMCSSASQGVRNEPINENTTEDFEEDPMVVEASERRESFAMPKEIYDQIIVIKKKGNKVIVEI